VPWSRLLAPNTPVRGTCIFSELRGHNTRCATRVPTTRREILPEIGSLRAHLKRDIERLSRRGSLLTAEKSFSSCPFSSLRQVFGSRRAFPVVCCQTNRRIAAWNFEPFLKSRRHTKGEVRSGDCSYGAPPHGWLCVQLLAACRDRSSAPRSNGETHHGHRKKYGEGY
jgi:hypothetical protein